MDDDPRISRYPNPYDLPLDRLKFWLKLWDEVSDREREYHEIKLQQTLLVLRLAIRDAQDKPEKSDRLMVLTKAYQDKQAEHELIYGKPDF